MMDEATPKWHKRAIAFFSTLTVALAVITFGPAPSAYATDLTVDPDNASLYLSTYTQWGTNDLGVYVYVQGDSSSFYGKGLEYKLYKSGNQTPIATSNFDDNMGVQATLSKPSSGYDRYFVELGSLVSNSITVAADSNPWQINLTANNTIFTTDDDMPGLNWASNTAFSSADDPALYILNTRTNQIVYKTHDAANGTAEIPRFYTGGSAEYIAYVADWDATATAKNDLTNVLYVSSSVQIARQSWWVGVHKNQSTANPKLVVELNQTLQDTHSSTSAYALYVLDKTTGLIIAKAIPNETSYTYEIQGLASGEKHTYQIVVAANNINTITDPDDLADIQAVSDSVNAQQDGWDVSLAVDHEQYGTGDASPVFTWQANKNITPSSGQGIYIVRDDDQIVYKSNDAGASGTFVADRTPENYNRGYTAYIALWDENATTVEDLSDTDVASEQVYVTINPFNLTLDATRDNQNKLRGLAITTTQPVKDPLVSGDSFEMFLLRAPENSWNYTMVAHSTSMDTDYTYNFNAAEKQGGFKYEVFITQAHEAQTESDVYQYGVYAGNFITIPSESPEGGNSEPPVTVTTDATNYTFGTQDNMPTVHWGVDHSIQDKGVYLVNPDTNTILARMHAGSETSGSFIPDRFYWEQYRSYIVVVGSWDAATTSALSLTNINQPARFTVSRTNFIVTDTNVHLADSAAQIKISFAINQPLLNADESTQHYAAYLFDTTANTLAQKYTAITSQTTYVVPENRWGHHFRLYIADATTPTVDNTADLEHVETFGPVVLADGIYWHASVSGSATTYGIDDSLPTFTYHTNYNFTDQQTYGIYIANSNTGKIIYKSNVILNTDSVTVPERQTAGTDEYAVYLGAWNSNADNISDLSQSSIKYVSSSLPVTYQMPDSYLYISDGYDLDSSVMHVTVYSDMAAEYNQTSTRYAVYLVNDQTGDVVARKISPTTGDNYNFTVADTSPRTYRAYIAKYVTNMPATRTDLQGVLKSSGKPNLAITTQLDHTSFAADDATPQLSWAVNQSLGTASPYGVYLVDKNNGKIVYASRNAKDSHAVERVWQTSLPTTYEVYVADWDTSANTLDDLENIQVHSDGANVTRILPTLHLAEVAPELGQTNSRVIVTENQNLSDSHYSTLPYALYLVDETSGTIEDMTQNAQTSYTFEITSLQLFERHNFKAYLAKYEPNITLKSQLSNIAISSAEAVQTSHYGFTTPELNSHRLAEGTTRLTYSYSTNAPYFFVYQLYLVDTDTNQIVHPVTSNVSSTYDTATQAWTYVGEAELSGFYGNEKPDRHYRLYIALSAINPETLADITPVGMSNQVTVTPAPWSFTLNLTSYPPDDQLSGSGINSYVLDAATKTMTYRVNNNSGDLMVRVEWETNRFIDATGYALYIVDANTNKIVAARDASQVWNGNSNIGYLNFDYKLPDPGLADASAYTKEAYEQAYAHMPTLKLKAVVATADPFAMTLADLTNVQISAGNITYKQDYTWGAALLHAYASVGLYPYACAVALDYVLVQDPPPGYDAYLVDDATGDIIYPTFDLEQLHPGQAMPYRAIDCKSTIHSWRIYVANKIPLNFTSSFATDGNISQFKSVLAKSNLLTPTLDYGLNGTFAAGPVKPGEMNGGSNPSEKSCQPCVGEPINSFSGHFFDNQTDLTTTGTLPLELKRSYDSGEATTYGPLGYGWSTNLVARLRQDSANLTLAQQNSLTVVQENGSTVTFNKNADASYTAPPRVLASLTHNTAVSKFILRRNDGTQLIFDDTTGLLLTVKDRHGNSWNLGYNSDGKLTSVGNNNDQTLTLTWTNDLITNVAANNGKSVAYGYTAGYLTEVTYSGISNHLHYHYTSQGLLDQTTNLFGGITYSTYDAQNRVVHQINPDGGEMSLTYTTATVGGIPTATTSITYPDNSVEKKVYNNQGQLLQSTKGYGTAVAATQNYQYGAQNQPTVITDGEGNTSYYAYDAAGNVAEVTDANGNLTAYDYDTYGQLTRVTNALGKTATFTYDATGNLTASKTFLDKVTHYHANSDGTPAWIETPNNVDTHARTMYGYDSKGFLNAIKDPLGKSSTTTNNAAGIPTVATDQLGNDTAYTLDNQQRVTRTDNPGSSYTTATYSPITGAVTASRDKTGQVTDYTYDTTGRVATQNNSLGTTTYTYDGLNRVVQAHDYAGRNTYAAYNPAGNLLGETDAAGNQTSYTYYKTGKQKTVQTARLKVTTYVYDPVGNLIQITDPRGNSSTATYDSLNRLKTSRNAKQQETKYTYDDDGHVLTEKKPDNALNNYVYDDDGNILSRTDETTGKYEAYMYNASDRLIDYRDRAGGHTVYAYTDRGELKSKTYAGITTRYTYDASGNLLSRGYDEGQGVNPQTKVDYAYDAKDRLVQTIKNNVTTAYQYDPITGDITYVGDAPDAQGQLDGISYAYNAADQLSDLTYKDGTVVHYTYNSDDSLHTVKLGAETLATYQYDADGNITNTSYGNGLQEEKSYNNADQLTATSIANGSNTVYARAYTLDSSGFITQAASSTAAGPTHTQITAYDVRGQLSDQHNAGDSSGNTFVYNTLGDLLQAGANAYTVGGLGQVLTTTRPGRSDTYAYDAAGNRVTQTAAVGSFSTTTTYAWSDDASLEHVSRGNKTEAYTYNASGLLQSIQAQETGTADSTNNLVWNDQTDIPVILEDSGNDYVYGNSITPIVQRQKTTQAISYLYADYQGSVVYAADNSGLSLATYQYDAYGNVDPDGTTDLTHVITKFGYVGQYYDEFNNLYYMRARWYDPTVAAFISVDPAILITGQPYAYALGNPLSFLDPLGLFAGMTDDQKLLAGIGLLIVGVIAGAAICAATALLGCLAIGGVALGAALGAADYALDSDCPSWEGAGRAAIIGGVAGAAGVGAGKALGYGFEHLTAGLTDKALLTYSKPLTSSVIHVAFEKTDKGYGHAFAYVYEHQVYHSINYTESEFAKNLAEITGERAWEDAIDPFKKSILEENEK